MGEESQRDLDDLRSWEEEEERKDMSLVWWLLGMKRGKGPLRRKVLMGQEVHSGPCRDLSAHVRPRERFPQEWGEG